MTTKAKDTTEYIRVEGGFLEVRQRIGAGKISASGKSHVVVSTGGFKAIAGSDVRINLTAITK